MAIIDKVLRSGKSKADKIFKNKYKGAKGSPFEFVDDLGSPPSFRSAKETVGTEKKKLKEIGAKIEKELRKQEKEKPLRDLMMGGTKYGSFKSCGAVCKLAKRGKGRAYGKNS